MIQKIYLKRTNSRRKFLPSNNLSKFSLNLIRIVICLIQFLSLNLYTYMITNTDICRRIRN